MSLCLLIGTAHAAKIAIIDSGTDYQHRDLVDQMWENIFDNTENGMDEDGNKLIDDIRGWNFAENNNKIIDYKYLHTFSTEVYRFFEIQGRIIRGTASTEDLDWYKRKANDQDFTKELGKFGNFIHGTHVAGIAAKGAKDNEILGIKIIPTEVKLPGGLSEQLSSKGDGWKKLLLKFFLSQLAKQQSKMLEQVGQYVAFHRVDIANGSFGIGPNQAKMIINLLFEQFLKRKPDSQEEDEFIKHILGEMLKNQKKMVEAAPHTLFVFAAGNDANDNDVYPTSPASIKAQNSITVAATLDRSALAPFSSYGHNTVHVAAPGVVIDSSIPGDEYLQVSGTSQAAPYVANVAGQIKSSNKNLRPVDIKRVIMETVDRKNFLQSKVETAGVVNKDRAIKAAQLSNKMTLSQAINQAQFEVKDISEHNALHMPTSPLAKDAYLPLPSLINL
jgi:subtilisin family serine protease